MSDDTIPVALDAFELGILMGTIHKLPIARANKYEKKYLKALNKLGVK